MSSQREYVRKLEGGGFEQSPKLWQLMHIDVLLLFFLLLLSVFGLMVLYSASSQSMEMVRKQASFLLGGYVALAVCAHIPALLYRRFAPFLYFIGLILLCAVVFFGDPSKGAQRWLEIPGLPRFQPAELMKLVTPLMAAWYLSTRVLPPRFKYIAATLLLALMPAALIMVQPDLGTAILVASSGCFVLLLAGIYWRYVFIALFIALLAAWPIWQFILHDYQRLRVLTLLDPERDKFGAGWNIMQSKTAIGSGGWTGAGWLEGTQSQLKFLPESHTDFILAVLAEEWGFLGVLCLLALYLCIIARTLVLAWAADTVFNKLVIASIGLTFFVYVFVNVGMVSGMLPVVGVPLPLISRGGTSIISLMVGFGIVMALSADKRQFSHH